jgi:hypothetical protein
MGCKAQNRASQLASQTPPAARSLLIPPSPPSSSSPVAHLPRVLPCPQPPPFPSAEQGQRKPARGSISRRLPPTRHNRWEGPRPALLLCVGFQRLRPATSSPVGYPHLRPATAPRNITVCASRHATTLRDYRRRRIGRHRWRSAPSDSVVGRRTQLFFVVLFRGLCAKV